MSGNSSIEAFRAALNGLVAATEARPNPVRSNPSAPSRHTMRRSVRSLGNPRSFARNNMAVRRKADGTYEADTPAEMAEFERLVGSFRTAPAPRPAPRRQRPAAAPRAPKPPREFEGELKDASAPVSYGQASFIVKACGGRAAVCPSWESYGDKVSSQDLLRAAGMTMGQASMIISELKAAGLDYCGINDANCAARARQILVASGFTCPLPARSRSNPWW